MVICGVTIASSEATLVWIDTASLQAVGGARVSLDDPYDKADIVRTGELVRQLLVEKKTDKVVVRKCSTAGKFNAGHVAYRLETIMALLSPCELVFTPAQSVAAYVKREEPALPPDLRKYQHDAYNTALSRVA